MRKVFIIGLLIGLSTAAMAQSDNSTAAPATEQKQPAVEQQAQPRNSVMTREQINKAILQLESYMKEHKDEPNYDDAAYQRRLSHLKSLHASDE